MLKTDSNLIKNLNISFFNICFQDRYLNQFYKIKSLPKNKKITSDFLEIIKNENHVLNIHCAL